MADDFILNSLSDMDPYDREERCRKTIRTLLRAIVVRIAAGVLLAVAVVRAGVSSVALGLTGFALLLILAGLFPLMICSGGSAKKLSLEVLLSAGMEFA